MQTEELDIENISKDYINIIRKIQPDGPYSIIGWSVGGTIAFEVVKQLENLKQKIKFFGIFDSVPPKNDIFKNLNIELLKNIYGEIKKNYFNNSENLYTEIENLVIYINSNFNDFKKLIPLDVLELIKNYRKKNVKDILHTINPLIAYLLAIEKYIPNSNINSKLKYYKSSETTQFNAHEWDKYCSLPVDHCIVSGDHFSMLKTPFVTNFVKKISDYYLNIQT